MDGDGLQLKEAHLFGVTILARPVLLWPLFSIAHFVVGPFWSRPF